MAIKFNRSQTFATNGTVTASGLHNLVDGLDVYQSLITDQTNLASIGTGDKLLIADSDLSAGDAPRSTTVLNLFEDALTAGTYTNANIAEQLSVGTGTFNRTVATSATITTGTIPNATLGTTTATAATITTGTIPNATLGTTSGTSATFTNGTIQSLTSSTANLTGGTFSGAINSTSGTIGNFRSTTGTITNLSTTLAGDFTISQGIGTLGESGVATGTYGASGIVPTISVDSKGRITTVSTSAVTVANASITPSKLSQPMTLGTAQNTTSGTAIDFTNIPSWVKKITVVFNVVSLSGSSSPLVQIGTGGSPTQSGYNGGTSAITAAAITMLTSTSGFPVFANTASYALNGSFVLINVSGNLWVASGTFYNVATTAYVAPVAGSVTLSGVLNMIRITTINGTDTFDGGSVNIMYEG